MTAATTDVRTALERLAEPAPHLRWRLGRADEPLADDELACAELADDPDALAAAVATTATGRGSDDPQVLASLWWQAYAYRVGGTALACWLLSGVAPDPRPEGTAVGIARSRPSAAVYLVPNPDVPSLGSRGNDSRPRALEAMSCGGRTSSPRETLGGSHCLADPGGDLAAFVDHLFPGHLDRVAGSLRARHRLGRSLIWGNVAAACASAAGSVRVAAGPGWRPRLDAFLAAAPHDLIAFGRWTFPTDMAATRPATGPDTTGTTGTTGTTDTTGTTGTTGTADTTGADPTYRRTTCCLWWKTSAAAGALCADCSLAHPARSPIETSPT